MKKLLIWIIPLFIGLVLLVTSFLLLINNKKDTQYALVNDTINGGIYIDYFVKDFNSDGFNEGDIFNLTFSTGYEIKNIKYYTSKGIIDDDLYLFGDEEKIYIKLISKNNEDLWKKANLDYDSTVKIEIINK